MAILDWLRQPWPWYVSGPLIGLTVPLLLIIGNKTFGISSSLRHACAILPSRIPYFRYDWKRVGGWNLAFAVGIVVGGFVAGGPLADPEPVRVAEATRVELAALGIETDGRLAPLELFGVQALGRAGNLLLLLLGEMLVGFGARYAGGCTSGHAISGLANLQLPSLAAVAAFFAGGLLATHLLLPLLLGS